MNKALTLERVITREIRRWDGITSQDDLQGLAPRMVKKIASATRRFIRRERKHKRTRP